MWCKSWGDCHVVGLLATTGLVAIASAHLPQLLSWQGIWDDRVVVAPVERPVTAPVIVIIQLGNRNSIVAIPVRSGVVPGHQRTFRKLFPGDLLENAGTVTVIYAGDMQPCVMAAL